MCPADHEGMSRHRRLRLASFFAALVTLAAPWSAPLAAAEARSAAQLRLPSERVPLPDSTSTFNGSQPSDWPQQTNRSRVLDFSRTLAPTDGWVWPLSPRPAVVKMFDPPAETWLAGHRGVDLLGETGQRVSAIGSGEVTFASNLAGRGVVVVSHGSLRSTYEPVTAGVEVGQRVQAGESLGSLQAPRSHCAPSVCLHLGVRRGTGYLDPLSLLGPLAVRLKPLGHTVDSMPTILSPGLSHGDQPHGGQPHGGQRRDARPASNSTAGRHDNSTLPPQSPTPAAPRGSSRSAAETLLTGGALAGGGLASLALAGVIGLRRRSQARG